MPDDDKPAPATTQQGTRPVNVVPEFPKEQKDAGSDREIRDQRVSRETK